MQIDREKFVTALRAVKPGVATKEVIEQTSSFFFADGQVISYNDEIMLSHPLDLGGLSGAVPSASLAAYLGKLRGEAVEVEEEEGKLVLRSGRSKASFEMAAEITAPIFEAELPEDGSFVALPADFDDAISFAGGSVSDNMNRAILTCIHLSGQRAESSDGHRLTRYQMQGAAFPEQGVLLPGRVVKDLRAFAPLAYALTAGWVHFSNLDGGLFSCRILEGDYPDLTNLLAISGLEIRFPVALGEMLERAGIFAAEDKTQDEQVRVAFTMGRLTIEGQGLTGKAEETCRCRYNGQDIAFMIHPRYLSEANPGTRRAILNEAGTMLKFVDDQVPFEHVICLLQPKKG